MYMMNQNRIKVSKIQVHSTKGKKISKENSGVFTSLNNELKISALASTSGRIKKNKDPFFT